MPRALVLLRVDTKIERAVLEEVRKIPGVEKAHYIFGPYDIYLKLAAETMEEIRMLVLEKIRTIYGVRSSITCFIVER